MENIFQIGGKVSGKSFIGRKKLLKDLRRTYVENNSRTGKAIVGLTRMGKSSVALNLFTDLPDNVLYIYEDLNEWSEYSELWQDICYAVGEYLEKTNKMTQEMSEHLEIMKREGLPWIKLVRSVKKIFEELAIMKIKTILVLDEFDNASTLFNAGTKHFELFRTIFSDGKYDVSAMTISRRSLHTIEGTTYQSSTFHGVLDSIAFKGFDEDDMEEYYQVFAENRIELSAEQKEDIEYYAGRAPLLLSVLGHYILESAAAGEEIDITSIFMNKCKAINDYYRDCIQHLTRDDDLKRIVPFIIGPNVGVTQNDKDELFNLGYLREQDGELIAISSYFVSFLSANMLKVSIWENVINLEKKIKQIIENEFLNVIDHYKAYGESIVAIQRNVLEKVDGITRGDISRYDSFIYNNVKVFNIQSNYLDVMSLRDAFKIIKDCWADIFANYFNQELYSSWGYKFEKCARARNPIAHGHEEYLSDIDKNEVDTYCKQIFEIILTADSKANLLPEEKEILACAEKYKVAEKIISKVQYEIPTEELLGKEVYFAVIMRGGKKRNNLQGILEEKYSAVLPRTELEGLDLDAMIGTTIKVKIEKIIRNYYELSLDRSQMVPAVSNQRGKEYSIADIVTSEKSF